MIALSTIKKALKIETDLDDADLLRLRDAVSAFVQEYTGLTFEPQTKTQYLPYWMRTRLEWTPFIDMVSVTYTDANGDPQTLPSTDYFMILNEYPTIFINFWEFPSIKEGTEIAVSYKVGYANLPQHIQHIIISLIGHWYNNPEAGAPITITTVPMSAQFVLETIRAKGAIS